MNCYTNTYFIALSFGCPFGKEKLNCVFKKYRNLESTKRIQVLENIKCEEKLLTINKHKTCLIQREKYNKIKAL